MKKILLPFLFALLFGAQSVQAQYYSEVILNAENFPDPQFRAYVSEITHTAIGDEILYTRQMQVTEINVANKGVSSLKGVEYFRNLSKLICYLNNLATLDVSENKSLVELHCWGNHLSSLNVSTLAELQVLSCDDNNLTYLNVTKNSQLTELTCHSNNLSSLDVSQNPLLEVLYCYQNHDLNSLDVSNNTKLTKLDTSICKLQQLDVSNNPLLEELDVSYNNLLSLDVFNNRNLKRLNCNGNQISFLNVGHCFDLQVLQAQSNRLISISGLENVMNLLYILCDNQVSTRRYYRIDYNGGQAWGLNCRIQDVSLISNLKIDGISKAPEVYNGYIIVSTDLKKIPQKVTYNMQVPLNSKMDVTVNYDVVSYGFKINGKDMTSLNMGDVPGVKEGDAYIDDFDSTEEGNLGWNKTPTLVLDEATLEWNNDNYGLLNQSCNLTIQVNSNSTIIADKYEGLKLNESTKTVISGGATLTIHSQRAAIDVGDMTRLTIQGDTKVIAQGDSYGYLDSGIYDGDGAYLEIKDGGVLAAYGNTESVSLGYRDVTLGSGIDLRYPVGATLWNGSVYDADGSKVKGDWVVFGPEGAEALVTPQAYACYTSDNTTLTFYYDKQRNSRTGTTYDLNEVYSNPGWFSDGTRSNVTQVVFDSSFADARPTTTTSWFVEMKNLQSITGLEYLNTSEVTNMRGMFGECISLTSLDLSHFNTAKVTYMDYMFYGCLCLKSIYVGDGWSTTAVTNSEEMFYGCTNLVGSKGTIYDENHIDANYAHIDGGPSNPGYLSQKRGDVNLDGSVDIADAVCVLNAMAGQPVAGDANVNGDYDEDGNPVVDIADLVTVLNIMAGQ